jgi:phage gp36-like protein
MDRRPAMNCRYTLAAPLVLAVVTSGCSSIGRNWLESARQQYTQAVEGMKADMAVLDSDDDGLDAFAPSDAKHLRAARADMGR